MVACKRYHVYKDVLEAAIGEILICQQERGNSTDVHGVAVMTDGVIVGHLPRRILHVSALFIRRDGTVNGT